MRNVYILKYDDTYIKINMPRAGIEPARLSADELKSSTLTTPSSRRLKIHLIYHQSIDRWINKTYFPIY